MAIDKINNVNAINQNGKVNKTSKVSSNGNDRIEISSESKAILEQKNIDEALALTPDIRMDKVELAKARLSTYMENGVIRKDVLDKMTNAIVDDLFGISIIDDI